LKATEIFERSEWRFLHFGVGLSIRVACRMEKMLLSCGETGKQQKEGEKQG